MPRIGIRGKECINSGSGTWVVSGLVGARVESTVVVVIVGIGTEEGEKRNQLPMIHKLWGY
jgi:hypothetical protein